MQLDENNNNVSPGTPTRRPQMTRSWWATQALAGDSREEAHPGQPASPCPRPSHQLRACPGGTFRANDGSLRSQISSLALSLCKGEQDAQSSTCRGHLGWGVIVKAEKETLAPRKTGTSRGTGRGFTHKCVPESIHIPSQSLEMPVGKALANQEKLRLFILKNGASA